jgi:hypothetical protein
MPRTILAHVNVELPDGSPWTAIDVEQELFNILQIAGDDPDNCPALATGTVVIALTEEV